MKAKLIAYDLSGLSQDYKVRVNRKLFGYTEYSTYGKYQYEREGVLDKVPHLKILRGGIIVKKEHHKQVTSILDKYNADYQIFDIIIEKSVLKNT